MGDHKFEGEHKGSSISEIKDKVTSDSASNNKDKVKVGVATKDGQLGFLFTRGGLREGAGRKSTGVTKRYH